MAARGRPVKSQIRQNIVEILYYLSEGYGYEIFKFYKALYPQCTQKSIYYHLRKGLSTGEFVIKTIKKEKGEYSWGSEVEKTYYALGPNAKPIMDERVQFHIEKTRRKPEEE
jgi:hypothetical protein